MTDTLLQVALVLGEAPLWSMLVKATATAAAALVFARLAHRHRASVRHAGLAAGFGVLLLLPVAIGLAPFLSLDLPVVIVDASAPAMVDVEPPVQNGTMSTQRSHATTSSTSVARPGGLLALMLGVWAGGGLVCLLPVVAGLWQLRRYRQHGIPLRLEHALFHHIARTMGIVRPVTLLAHDAVAGPMTYGVWRPVVLLPPDSSAWDTDVLRSALVHELEHVRRADCLTHAVSRIVCALYWFHPLVWAMHRRLTLEAERACDDAVLRDTEPTQYAHQLVDLAERLSHDARQPLLAMASRDELSTRITAVLDPTLPRGRAGLTATFAIAVAATLVAAAAPVRAVALPMPQATAPAMRTTPLPAGPAVSATVSAPVAAPPSPRASAQTPAAAQFPAAALPQRPDFEAASIKRTTLDGPIRGVDLAQPGRVTARNTLLRLIIAAAYQPGFTPRRSQMSIVGLPDWDETEHFDLDAVAPSNPNVNVKRLMLQSLLADRFKLALHPETRQGPVFDLVVARAGRLGPQLTPHSPTAPCVDPSLPPLAPAGATFPPPPPPPPPCGGIRVQSAYWGSTMTTRMSGNGVTMQAIAERLTWFQDADRTVIEKTALTGLFDFSVEWTPNVQLPPPAGADLSGLPASDKPTEFTALQEQLGLRLQPATGPVDVLVIDRVERPSPD